MELKHTHAYLFEKINNSYAAIIDGRGSNSFSKRRFRLACRKIAIKNSFLMVYDPRSSTAKHLLEHL